MRMLSGLAGGLVIISFTFFAQQLDAQVSGEPIRGAERTYIKKLGQTAPLRDVLETMPTAEQKLYEIKQNKPSYVRNFVGRRATKNLKEGALPRGADPLIGEEWTRDGGIVLEPEVVFEALSEEASGSGVPDVNGDVSDQYFVETVNSTWIQVYDLQGNMVGNRFHANTIWSQVGYSSAGDPIIIYDQEVDRWFLTEFPPSNNVLLAVSDTEDPMGSWTAYAFSTPAFPDYPKYGIWPEAYVLTTNEGGGGTVKFYVINREQILNGEDTVDMQRFVIPRLPEVSFQVLTPVNWIGDSLPPPDLGPMVMRINDDAWGEADNDRLEIYQIQVDWEDEGNTVINPVFLETAPFDAEFCSEDGPGFTCVPQPNGVGTDGIPWLIMNRMEYRQFDGYGSIVLNFTVDASGEDDAGIRWMELRREGTGLWEIYQEGTVGTDDGENRFMGGISIDSKGNIGLGYSVTSETTFASLRFTGRRPSDPLGTMTIREYEFATGGGSVPGSRFGDYASMTVDRQDMFWYAGEYVLTGSDWNTKVVGFKLTRPAVDIGPYSLIAPADDPDLEEETVSFTVVNNGVEPQSEFAVGYIFDDGTPVIEEVDTDTLFTDSTYTHVFATPVTFSDFGSYPLLVFTSLESDSTAVNDTCRFTITKQTRYDATVLGVQGANQIICDTFVDGAIAIRNVGVDTLTSATVTWILNSGQKNIIDWTGSLATGESEEIPVIFDNLVAGINTLQVYTTDPNTQVDQFAGNDTLTVELNSTPGGDRVVMNFTTDLFPNETTWELLDSNGNVLFESGTLTAENETIVYEWCLDPEQCYQFVLFDSFGDGIQAYGVEGDFQILNAEGLVVASLAEANFGDVDTTDFCLEFECMLQLGQFIAHESTPGAGNGLISINVSGGNTPYQFSIDGGQTTQISPIFTGVEPGMYELHVTDASGCIITKEVEVLACSIQLMTEITSASGMDIADGIISVIAEGGNGPLEYSINGGQTFQDSPLFENVPPGQYNVVVEDSVGCSVTTGVEVEFSSSVVTTTKGHLIKVFPNPSDGEFYFEILGLPEQIFLDYNIIDLTGRIVQHNTAANYSGVIKGSFRLLNQPSGLYLLRFDHPELNTMIRVVKN